MIGGLYLTFSTQKKPTTELNSQEREKKLQHERHMASAELIQKREDYRHKTQELFFNLEFSTFQNEF